MAPHSSILAGRIPWTEEPDGLQSMGSHESGMTWRLSHQTSNQLSGFPGGSVGKNPPAEAGGPGLIPGLGMSPGEGRGNPRQDSCLENSTEEPGGL